MNIDAIRNTFSKGAIAITDRKIMAIYALEGRWITQPIQEYKATFVSLLRLSERLIIERNPGKTIRFIFQNEIDNQEPIFYPPLTEEVSLEEMRRMTESSFEKNPNTEFIEFFSGVDLSDGDAIMDKLREFFDREAETHKLDPVSFSVAVRWKRVYEDVMSLANSLGFECEVLEPDYISDGSISIYFPDKFKKTLVIEKELKEKFIEIIDFCSGIDFECNTDDGTLNLNFYT